jgi:hypothetical protein
LSLFLDGCRTKPLVMPLANQIEKEVLVEMMFDIPHFTFQLAIILFSM